MVGGLSLSAKHPVAQVASYVQPSENTDLPSALPLPKMKYTQASEVTQTGAEPDAAVSAFD